MYYVHKCSYNHRFFFPFDPQAYIMKNTETGDNNSAMSIPINIETNTV